MMESMAGLGCVFLGLWIGLVWCVLFSYLNFGRVIIQN